jgi:hypothetical protein
MRHMLKPIYSIQGNRPCNATSPLLLLHLLSTFVTPCSMTAIYVGSICIRFNCDKVFSDMTMAASVQFGSIVIVLAKIGLAVKYY